MGSSLRSRSAVRLASLLLCAAALGACSGSSDDPSSTHDDQNNAAGEGAADGAVLAHDGGILVPSGSDDMVTPEDIAEQMEEVAAGRLMPAPPELGRPRTFEPPFGPWPARAQRKAAGPGQPASPYQPPIPPELPPGGREALCALRDKLAELPEEPFGALGLGELARNYFCDGGCFMCCLVPQNGGCHTSFDYDDDGDAPVNCNSGTYGAGTTIVGEALIYGDSLGLGICIGGVQQTCNHLPVCTASSAGAAKAKSTADAELMSSLPPHADMVREGAAGSRAKAFVKALMHAFTEEARKQPVHLRRDRYVDLVTVRGARGFEALVGAQEPFNRTFEVFRRENDAAELIEADSYGLGVLYHATLALLGSVPHALDRLAYVESRYWTDQEKAAYLSGVDAEAELRKTMGPLAFDILAQLPIQDFRLLAVPAPGEEALGVRLYHGAELGSAPTVTVARDCVEEEDVSLVLRVDDPLAAERAGAPYPVVVNWGDGTFSSHLHDPARPAAMRHRYEQPGRYLAYVTTHNASGLRGIAGLVVEAAAASTNDVPAVLGKVNFDDLVAYGPALTTAGSLRLKVEGARTNGQRVLLGFSEQKALANAGPTVMAPLVAHNTSLLPFDTLVVIPENQGAGRFESIYLQFPSLTLGFYDPELGALVERRVPLEELPLAIYYRGATQPIPSDLIEHDLNGRPIIPLDRTVPGLAQDFCGADPCRVVERIEIAVTAELLAKRPAASSFVPELLSTHSAARWLEDVPDRFVPVADLEPLSFPGVCSETLHVQPIAGARSLTPSHAVSLRLSSAAAEIVGAMPIRLTAFATLADGREVDVTDRVSWHVADPTVLRVDNGANKGELRASVVPGTSAVIATLGDLETTLVGTNASPERGYASYRVEVQAVHGPVGRTGVNSVELFVDGELLQNAMTSESEGSIGPYPATVSASSGGSALGAFDASTGTGWSSATDSFATSEPYAVGAEPVYLQVTFAHPVPLTAVRLVRQAGINSASFRPQFPRVLQVQGSHDGQTFVPLVTYTVENWDFAPLVVAVPSAND